MLRERTHPLFHSSPPVDKNADPLMGGWGQEGGEGGNGNHIILTLKSRP